MKIKTGVGENIEMKMVQTLKWKDFNNLQLNWMTLMAHHTDWKHMFKISEPWIVQYTFMILISGNIYWKYEM